MQIHLCSCSGNQVILLLLLLLLLGAKPKKQKPQKMSNEKAAAVKAEVQRLLDAKVIREVKYRRMENGECA
jgi:hypothetical protein